MSVGLRSPLDRFRPEEKEIDLPDIGIIGSSPLKMQHFVAVWII